MRSRVFLPLALVFVILALGCIEASQNELPNPAAVYCEDQGHSYEIRDGEGGQYGVCVFPDGSECDGWDYFRGKCGPGTQEPEYENPAEGRAIEVAKAHVKEMSEYADGGRGLRRTDLLQARCPGCWMVELQFDRDSQEAAGKTDRITVKVMLEGWEVADAESSKATITVLTPEECDAIGGRVLNTLGGFECYDNEVEEGEVEGLLCPCVCCVPLG